jgi:PKD repeat protein
MRRFLLLFTILLANFISNAQAPCPTCPNFLQITDPDQCTRLELPIVLQGQSDGTVANTQGSIISYCKNSTTVLCIQPMPFGGCSYPVPSTLNVTSISGGTILSNSGNCLTIQWGNVNSANLVLNFQFGGNSTAGQPPCNINANLSINLINNPVAAFTAVPSTACFNSPTTINFNSSATTGAATYIWDFGDGAIGTGANPSHNYYAPGTYTVCLYANGAPPDTNGSAGLSTKCLGCTDTFCSVVTIDSAIGPDINCVNTVCPGEIDQYCTSAPCGTFTWSAVGGTIVSGQNTNCVSVQWGNGTPQGSLSLVVGGCTGNYCNLPTTVTVPIVPAVAVMSGATITCAGNTEAYNIPSMPGTSYNWTLTGPATGSIVGNNTNTSNVSCVFTGVGIFTLTCTYTNNALACTGTSSLVIFARPKGKITGAATLCEGSSSSYTAGYVGSGIAISASTWSVSPATATIISGQGTGNANIQFSTPGTYTISTSITAPVSACDVATKIVEVTANPIISGLNGTATICAGGTNNFGVVSSDNTGFFSWYITGGSYTPVSINQDSVIITWSPIGPYQVIVEQINSAGCIDSFTQTFTASAPATITGPTNVCADDVVVYTVTSSVTGTYQWFSNPPQFAALISAAGTNPATIQWNGSNSPGFSNTVYLYYGVCGTDSIAVTITDPAPLTITPSGSLCSGGVSLATGVTGSHVWSCLEHAISPAQSNTNTTLVNLDQPGTYAVTVTGMNGGGCNASASRKISSTGLPVAEINTNTDPVFCTPYTSGLTLSAVTGAGYSYQWLYNGNVVGTGTSLAITNAAPFNISASGTYTFYLVVSLGSCTDTSNRLLMFVSPCTGSGQGAPGCPSSIVINSINGCNAFAITSTISSTPAGTPVPNSQTIFDYGTSITTNGDSTIVYNTIGVQPIRVCKSINVPGVGVCPACIDTSVTVTLLANFIPDQNCGIVNFINLSQAAGGASITSYAWTVTKADGSPAPLATFNNASLVSPILTFADTGTYTVTLTITGSNGCSTSYNRNIVSRYLEANFGYTGPCVGTPTAFTATANTASINITNHYWDFGDASSSYINPTVHTYATNGLYTVTYAVKDLFGCVDTVIDFVPIAVKPTCTIAYTGPNVFCDYDSLVLSACAGAVSYQWYLNGAAISGANGLNYTAKATGNYSVLAISPIGCTIESDTVIVLVNPSASAAITGNPPYCYASVADFNVSSCSGCNYVWFIDGNFVSTASNTYSEFAGFGNLPIGTHTVTATVVTSAGCSTTDSIVITVEPQPSVTATIIGSGPFCSNQPNLIVATSSSTSPSYVWQHAGFNISTNDSIIGISSGTYDVIVTDGITGCTNLSNAFISPSPDLSLFPTGCDSLCISENCPMPIPTINYDTSVYTINWYNNAPPYVSVGTGTSFPLSSLTPGSHNLSVIVSNAFGCVDTSNVFSIFLINCPPLGVAHLELAAQRINACNVLQWQDAVPSVARNYTIERRTENGVFAQIATHNATGDKINTLHDCQANQNIDNYYRISKYDIYGAITQSNIVLIAAIQSLSIAAVPTAFDKSFDLYINSINGKQAELSIYNSSGQAVYAKTQALGSQHEQFTIATDTWSSGMYTVRVVCEGTVMFTKVLKR